MIHRTCSEISSADEQWTFCDAHIWWRVGWGLTCVSQWLWTCIYLKKKKNSGSELGVLQNTFSLLIFPCACVCFCVHVRVYGALELRNEFDLPSASLMHANLLLASQENNFSHSTNKVQTPATQSSRVLTGRDSSNETHARKSPAERGSKLQISCWKLIV